MADGGKVIIKIDGDNNGFKNAMGGIGKIAGTAFKGIAIGATAAATAIGAIGTAAATAIGAIGTAAVKSYAEFEQLSGGAQKIFDEIDYAKIKKDADEAFKTMQISANQYLQLMTTVGANFASTLGDAKGYEVAKQGMKAITDFATGTGRSIDELSEKYQMITKSTSSYQSIADQFAGVLPATSAEFLKQAQAAGILSENYTKLTEVPMAEYQEAVTQMIAKGVDALGLTNNAANEAATTLSGSFNMLKASWDNLMVGLADPSQDLDTLIDNVINSATALLENVGPIIENVLDSLPIAINTLGTKLIQALPGLVNVLLPELANTASQLIDTLTQALTSNAESLGTTALTIFMTLVNCLLENLPLLLDTALTLIITLAEGFTQALPQLIPSIVSVVLKIVDTLLNNIDMLVDVAIELILALTDGIIQALPILMEKAPEIIVKLVDAIIRNLPKILSAGIEIIVNLWNGITNGISTYLSAWGNIIHEKIIQPVKDKASEMIQAGKDLLAGLWNGINDKVEWLKGKVSGVVNKIKSWFTGKDGFDEHSPSKWSEQVFAYVMDGGVNGLEKRKNKLINKVGEIVKDVKSEFQKAEEENRKNTEQTKFKQDLSFAQSTEEILKIKDREVAGLSKADKEYLAEKARIERKALEESRKAEEQKLKEEHEANKKRINGEKNLKERQKKLEDENNRYAIEQTNLKNKWFKEDNKKAQEAYLENLKLTADKERKIYEALQKDIEDSKKQIIDNFTQMTESAFDSIEELENAQKAFADKLKSYGSLYRTYELPTITLKNGEQITPERTELADLKKQNQVLKDYADALQAVKKKGNVPKEFFAILRDMSVEEGSKFAKTLLSASQEDFDAYIKDWETNQKLAEDLSKEMFADEAKDLKTEIISTFDMAASEFFEAGEDSAKEFGEGFVEELKNMFTTVRAELNTYLKNISPSVAIAGMGNGTAFSSSNSYSPTYNIYGPYDQSTREQIKAENTKTKLQWLRGGYNS